MDLSITGVFLASIAAFAFGALWYSPLLFIERWCKEAGIDPDIQLDNPGKVYGLTFLLTVISAIGLGLLLGVDAGILRGAGTGLITGLLVVMTSMGINYQFAGRTLGHWLIDGGFQTCRFVIIGAIIGLF